jgi:hypothetical protein
MKISEKCSCGARFKADGETAPRLLREWRKQHACPETTPAEELRDVAMSAQVENAIGFRVEGLQVPAPDYDPWEDRRK